jgi:hypothetical protein
VHRNPLAGERAWVLSDDAGRLIEKADGRPLSFANGNQAREFARKLGDGDSRLPQIRREFKQQEFAVEKLGLRGTEFVGRGVGDPIRRRAIRLDKDNYWVYDPDKLQFGISPNGNPVVFNKTPGIARDQRMVRLDDVISDPEAIGIERFGSLKDVNASLRVNFPNEVVAN